VYDRLGDADIRVKGTHQIAEMYIRKHDIFTERRVYKYVTEEDLRLDMLPRLRQMALNRIVDHPWKTMSDANLLRSSGLYGEDKATGEKGYLLAAVMLLGKDDVIRSVVPAYRTDALLRKVNVDRYDDRLIVQTNLIESYELLMGFAEKHLPDKFYLEADARISLRNAISREMLVNTLVHREFTSSYIAKFIIEKERMFTENANRAASDDPLTPDNYEPNPKNPLVAAFFRNIGLADELGSGVRKLFKYGRRYSGKAPQLIDGDVFRAIVPLDDSYSFDAGIGESKKKTPIKTSKPQNEEERAVIEVLIVEHVKANPQVTQKEVIEASGKSKRAIQTGFATLQERGILVRQGSKMNGLWIVAKD
jgi:ATP-dependent DNA helicase RecG